MSDYWKLFLWWHSCGPFSCGPWSCGPLSSFEVISHFRYKGSLLPWSRWSSDRSSFWIPIWTCMCQHNPDWSTKQSWSLFSIETDSNLSREWNVSGRIELIGFESTWIWTMWTREFKKPGWSSMKLLPERVKSFKGFKMMVANQMSEIG